VLSVVNVVGTTKTGSLIDDIVREGAMRAVNTPRLVALVRAGARFERGQLLERSQTTAA
jgi:hypothetical protein